MMSSEERVKYTTLAYSIRSYERELEKLKELFLNITSKNESISPILIREEYRLRIKLMRLKEKFWEEATESYAKT